MSSPAQPPPRMISMDHEDAVIRFAAAEAKALQGPFHHVRSGGHNVELPRDLKAALINRILDVEPCDVPYQLVNLASEAFVDDDDSTTTALLMIAAVRNGNQDGNFLSELEDDNPGIVDDIRDIRTQAELDLVRGRLRPRILKCEA